MLAHVGNVHTEMAGSLVDHQHSRLEDGLSLLALVIEVMEGHEVSDKPVEITEDMEELVDHLDIAGFL